MVQSEAHGMAPEDELLFQDLEEDSVQSKASSGGSWLRYMEYGDVSVLTKASAHPTSSMSLQDETPSISNTTRTERIEHSFSHTPPVHKDKSKSVVAECVWEVFPDEVNSCFDFGLVVGAFLRIKL